MSRFFIILAICLASSIYNASAEDHPYKYTFPTMSPSSIAITTGSFAPITMTQPKTNQFPSVQPVVSPSVIQFEAPSVSPSVMKFEAPSVAPSVKYIFPTASVVPPKTSPKASPKTSPKGKPIPKVN